ncbi:excinuclease ABC subunit UvrA, partial [Lactobacillus sp. XV13L]|nr:excinuclease ABC subunit UvrA [Lactobacillus sp. XV13L]
QFGIDQDTPFNKLPLAQQNFLLYGSKEQQFHFHFDNDFGSVRDVDTTFEGVIPNIAHRYRKPSSAFMRDIMRKYMTESVCQTCQGTRLNPKALSVQIAKKNIAEVSELPIKKALPFFKSINLSPQNAVIAKPILKEVLDRLTFLQNVGLDYLTLSRSAGTLSGGEAQRIRLATQIGSNLSGVLYILDEPSIGLHQRDNDRLIKSLKAMRDLGNTLIVVEHDEDTMRQADYLIDVGPGAGAAGGQVVAAGTPAEVAANSHSLTGQYLSGKKYIPLPPQRRLGNGQTVKIYGARENNLKN